MLREHAKPLALLDSLNNGNPVSALAMDAAFAADSLPSWNDGPTKQGIISFVENVTKEGAPTFIPIAERIATLRASARRAALRSARCSGVSGTPLTGPPRC